MAFQKSRAFPQLPAPQKFRTAILQKRIISGLKAICAKKKLPASGNLECYSHVIRRVPTAASDQQDQVSHTRHQGNGHRDQLKIGMRNPENKLMTTKSQSDSKYEKGYVRA